MQKKQQPSNADGPLITRGNAADGGPKPASNAADEDAP